MFEESTSSGPLRERLTASTEDKLGRALADLLENPLVTGAIGKAFDARDRAMQAQELALSALNIPTAADIERLTRRLRSVSQRLEGIEDGVQRINRALASDAVERRLSAMEEQLKTLNGKLSEKTAPAKASAKAATTEPAKASGEGAPAPGGRSVKTEPAKAPAQPRRRRPSSQPPA